MRAVEQILGNPSAWEAKDEHIASSDYPTWAFLREFGVQRRRSISSITVGVSGGEEGFTAFMAAFWGLGLYTTLLSRDIFLLFVKISRS